MMNIFETRRKRAQEAMSEKAVSALQVTSRENYFYLTGDARNVTRLFLPQKGEPTVIVFDEEAEAARKATGISDVRGWKTPSQLMQTFFQVVKEHNVAGKKVGFCVHSNPGFLVYKFIRSNPKMMVIENEEILMPLRYVKDEEELQLMKRSAEIAEKGMAAAVKAIKPGVTEIEVAAEAEYAMRRAGAMRFGASTFVDSGPHSLFLHGGTTRKRLENGDFVVVDLHPIVDMYASDCARTLVCGSASSTQERLIEIYENAQQAVIDSIRPGWKISSITKAFMEVFLKEGYGETWIQGPTHGVGLEFEEWPHPSHYPAHSQLDIGLNWTLAIGHSILPVRPVGGVKVEDVVQITVEGGRKFV
jgi:Xaa-Pro dipeptidase